MVVYDANDVNTVNIITIKTLSSKQNIIDILLILPHIDESNVFFVRVIMYVLIKSVVSIVELKSLLTNVSLKESYVVKHRKQTCKQINRLD